MNGLQPHEVEYRINNNMCNNENIKNSRSIKVIILSNVMTLFNLINIVLFILVLTTGSFNNTFFIVTIFVNMIIGIYQEIKAKRIIDSLTISNTSKVCVVRGGKKINILPSEVLLDDVLYLKQGDSLVVDVEIIQSKYCEVDESIITGESNSIFKQNGDKIISGSIIICGEVYAKVVSINKDTYANNLIKEATGIRDDNSYLKKSINSILKIVTILIVPVGMLLFITQFYFSGQSYVESILSSVAGIIGMIPDGLVLLTSISLSVGVVKMAKSKVIIQKLNGIELLSCVDILCLDKTGTITDGSMKVIDCIYKNNELDIDNIISNMAINKVNITDIALSNYFKFKKKLDVIEYIPFSSTRKYSYFKFRNGIYALGALEYVTDKINEDFSELKDYIDNGYRIITLVECNNSFNKDTNKILAFIILKDNIRKNTKEILEYFKKQNIDIKIISGDNPKTVSNILKQLDIDDCDKYISFDKMDDNYERIKDMVKKYKIFGRVNPYQKQVIIKALKEENTVGMIGDGVNDILALKEADCGIALASGISAARSVSEIVLTDLDFAVLPQIVNEGRRVINNIERVASMFLIKTVYSFLLSILCIILTHEYPFYPVQLTLIGITCVGLPSFFLALEPNYKKVSKAFLVKVFKNALPSGVCVCVNIIFLMIFAHMFKLDFEIFRLTIVVTTGYLNLRLLYKVSLPLSFWHKILLCVSSISFILLLTLFKNFFLINVYNILSFLFIFVMIFIDNYIIDFLEIVYDKFILYIQKKRGTMYCNEK